jgi:hypothetical protein
MTRRFINGVLAIGVSALLVQPGSAQQERRIREEKRVRARGYVVDVLSPTRFVLDDVNIVEDRTYRVDLRNLPDAESVVRVGADLEVEGQIDPSTQELLATGVRRRPPPRDYTPETSTISEAVPFEPAETSLWKWLRVEVKEPDFDRRRSGRVRIRHRPEYEIIASADAQRYLADLGRRLVPAFQRDLPSDDAAKIPFRFYVIRSQRPGATAVASVILMHSRTFEILKNEAQMASVLAHEIAHVTQKHAWRLSKLAPSFKVEYTRAYENQADRLALDYMTEAGYDPREAARSWKVFAEKLGFTPLRSTHESHPVRRAFIMGELEARYDRMDYGTLRAGDERYAEIAGRVKSF